MKYAISFFAAFLGWAAAFVCLILWLVNPFDRYGYMTDFEFLFWWPMLFAGLGWLVFGLLFVWWVSPDSKWLDFPRSALVGALLSYGAFLVLIGYAVPLGFLHLFAAFIGFVGVPVYSKLVRHLKDARHARAWTAFFLLAPPAILALFAFVLWPMAERTVPWVLYHYASTSSRQRMKEAVFSRIEVGDTFEELHDSLPHVFDEHFLEMNSEFGGKRFKIKMKEGKVTEIQRE